MAPCARGSLRCRVYGRECVGRLAASRQRRLLLQTSAAGVATLKLLLLGCAASVCADEARPSRDLIDDYGSWHNGDTGSCSAAYCQHRGDCYGWNEASADHRCRCWSGYEGQFCETDTDECAPSLCRNRAACAESSSDPSVAAGEYRCDCRPGYSGDDCEQDVDECASNPCANGATCSEHTDAYTCQCAQGYDGTDCTIDLDECVPPPCLNGAECLESGRDPSVPAGTRRCQCITGYTGVHCETDLLDPCTSSPCANNATCSVVEVEHGVEFGFACACKPGFSGERCAACADGHVGRLCEAVGLSVPAVSAASVSQALPTDEPGWSHDILIGLGMLALVLCCAILVAVFMPAGSLQQDYTQDLQKCCWPYCGVSKLCAKDNPTQDHTISPKWLMVGPDPEMQEPAYYYNLETGEETTTVPLGEQQRSRQPLDAERQPLQLGSPVVQRQLFLEPDGRLSPSLMGSPGSRGLVASQGYSPSIVSMDRIDRGRTMNPLYPTLPSNGAEDTLAQRDRVLAGPVTRIYRRQLKWQGDPSGSYGNDLAAGYGLRLDSASPSSEWPMVDKVRRGIVSIGELGKDIDGVRPGHIVLRIGSRDVRHHDVTEAIVLANDDVETKLQPRKRCSCELHHPCRPAERCCPCWPAETRETFPVPRQYHRIEWVFGVLGTRDMTSADRLSPRRSPPATWLEPEPQAEPHGSEPLLIAGSYGMDLEPMVESNSGAGGGPATGSGEDANVRNICGRADLGFPSPEKVMRVLEQHRSSINQVASAVKALRKDFETPSAENQQSPQPLAQQPQARTRTQTKQLEAAAVPPYAQRIFPVSPAPSRSRSSPRSPSSPSATRYSSGGRGGKVGSGRRQTKVPKPDPPPRPSIERGRYSSVL